MPSAPSWPVDASSAGSALAAFVRARAGGEPWAKVKRWIASGKVFIDGKVETGEGTRLRAGQVVELRMAAAGPRPDKEARLVHEDSSVVVIDKPVGISSVPYDEKETNTAMDLIRDAWRRMGRPATSTPLHVVHRIDKDTSGLIVFAKTKPAEKGLQAQFRAHTVERTYLCVAHGDVRAARIESSLVEDRGDGLRGSARHAGQGKRAVTHVKPLERIGRSATLCEVKLETGKTHQIRIHMAERGHPLVGERVYVRDYTRDGTEPLASPRLLLHAATLGFEHPVTGKMLSFESPLPPDFTAVTASLARR
jgi:23S rRNA pseudouridine1911/1915/1917 synthase